MSSPSPHSSCPSYSPRYVHNKLGIRSLCGGVCIRARVYLYTWPWLCKHGRCICAFVYKKIFFWFLVLHNKGPRLQNLRHSLILCKYLCTADLCPEKGVTHFVSTLYVKKGQSSQRIRFTLILILKSIQNLSQFPGISLL